MISSTPCRPEHPVGLGPAAVVADELADDPAEGALGHEALGAGVEVALLEVLELAPRLEVGVPRQVDLAVAVDDLALLVDQDHRVVAAGLAPGCPGLDVASSA